MAMRYDALVATLLDDSSRPASRKYSARRLRVLQDAVITGKQPTSRCNASVAHDWQRQRCAHLLGWLSGPQCLISYASQITTIYYRESSSDLEHRSGQHSEHRSEDTRGTSHDARSSAVLKRKARSARVTDDGRGLDSRALRGVRTGRGDVDDGAGRRRRGRRRRRYRRRLGGLDNGVLNAADRLGDNGNGAGVGLNGLRGVLGGAAGDDRDGGRDDGRLRLRAFLSSVL